MRRLCLSEADHTPVRVGRSRAGMCSTCGTVLELGEVRLRLLLHSVPVFPPLAPGQVIRLIEPETWADYLHHAEIGSK